MFSHQLLAALADTTDGVSHWFACLAVSYAITGNPKAKDMLLGFKVHAECAGRYMYICICIYVYTHTYIFTYMYMYIVDFFICIFYVY